MKRLLILLLLAISIFGCASAAVTETISFVEDGGNNYTVIKWTTNLAAGGGQDSTTWDADAAGATEVEYLVVAGGGGGGASRAAGGGAGGYRADTVFAVSGTVDVKIGAGGSGGTSLGDGGNGSNSQFSTIISAGGGGGIGQARGNNGFDAADGGSGSGQYCSAVTEPNGAIGHASPAGQGNNGGTALTAKTSPYCAGGGGGAGSAGVNAAGTQCGNGGTGLQNDITGTNLYYAAGGGAGAYDGAAKGTGGSGIGGDGAAQDTSAPTAGAANTGSGGGGGGTATYIDGAAGGSGIVIIRYLPPGATASFTQNQTDGLYPLGVLFTDTSAGYPITYNWSVYHTGTGPSLPLATTRNYSHYFNSGGNYTINLTITNVTQSTAIGYVDVWNQTLADFAANQTEGVGQSMAVVFAEMTSNATSWYWDFGDGTTSTNQTGVHTYTPGIYTVSLNASNPHDFTWENKTDYIKLYCAEFSGTPVRGVLPLAVVFSDLTQGSPTAWNWSFGDGTFSELQNPSHTYTSQGLYTVNLTATIIGSDCTESKANYISAGYTSAPTVAFAANKTEGASPFVVQFTDSSTQSPTAWNWSFGGDGYSDDQNPVYTFNTPGTYWINLTATNPLGSGYLNKSAYITVKAAGTTIVDFSASPTSGSPGALVQFTDLSVVTNTSSLKYNWSFGDGTYSDTIGDVQHVYSYASVYDANLTITNNVSQEYELKQQYITISVSDKTTWYTPVQVPIRAFNEYGAPIVGILVSATPQNFTAPADWAENLIGVNPTVNISGTTVSGYTGTDGSWVAPVIQSQYYRFVFKNATEGIHHEAYFYPSDPSYRIFITTGATVNQTYTQIANSNLTFSQPNASYITMGMYYQDTSTLTGNVTFTVSDWKNGTVYFEQTFTSGYVTNPVTSSFTTPNVRGDEFVWKWVAYRSDGSVLSQANSLLSKGPSGVMVDLGLPSVDWYQWISIFVIFLIGSLSSQRTKQFWAILIPVFASLFLWWGWFGIGIETVIGGLVIFCAVLGVIIYMKASLREKHGVGGPGSIVLNIVFYLIILQACIGFVNGIGVWDVNTAVTDSPYKNVDITRDIPAIENAGGGMSDVAAVSLVLWDMGFSLMRVLWGIVTAIAFIYPTLQTMFPFLVGSQQTLDLLLLLQIGIWVAYALFAYKFVKGEIGTLEL